MFWGLIMEPGKKYSQQVEQSFHISHAALDLNNAGNDHVQVLLGFDKRNYLLCTLQKGKCVQTPLDLNFQEGDIVSFTSNGPGHVHLTGYLIPEDDYGMMADDEAEEEESDEEAGVTDSSKKRKANENINSVAKKSKTAELLDEVKSDDTDDSDDSDVNLTDILDGDGDAEEAEEEEDDDEEESAEEEEDDSDDEMDDDSDEEEEDNKKTKESVEEIKHNGLAKPKTTNQKANKEKNKIPQQNEKHQKGEKTPGNKGWEVGQKTPGKEGTPGKKTVEGGVIIEEIKVGDGAVAKPGKIVQVYYEGRLKSNNKQFDATKQGPGFKFRLGKQEVIKGWDVGLSGMKVGGKRRITCPPNMAYGAKGSPPVIPPNSALIFEVELKNVKN